eukprot:4668488-Ditylum_brightwellii.AAC.1
MKQPKIKIIRKVFFVIFLIDIVCIHEQFASGPEEATIWVILCVAQAEQHWGAAAGHQCWHEAAQYEQGLMGPAGQQPDWRNAGVDCEHRARQGHFGG